MLASGGTPSEPIRIRRSCGIGSTALGFTNSKGQFRFEVGALNLAAGDASSKGSGGRGSSVQSTLNPGSNSVNLAGCSLLADAPPGFQSTAVPLTNLLSAGGRNDVGTIILTPRAGVSGSIVSATSLAAPKKAVALFEKGVKEMQKGAKMNSAKATKALQGAVEIYPEYAAAWTFLGQARLQAGDVPGARAALERAFEADPQYARPFEPLVRVAASQKDWTRVSEVVTHALRLAPGDTRMRWFQAVSQFELKDHDAAVATLTEIQKDQEAAREFPQSHHVLGLIYAQRGRFPEAAAEFRRFLDLAPAAPAGEQLRRQISEWERLGAI